MLFFLFETFILFGLFLVDVYILVNIGLILFTGDVCFDYLGVSDFLLLWIDLLDVLKRFRGGGGREGCGIFFLVFRYFVKWSVFSR